ncbi:hypothetical protein [Methylocystis echinoides]
MSKRNDSILVKVKLSNNVTFTLPGMDKLRMTPERPVAPAAAMR